LRPLWGRLTTAITPDTASNELIALLPRREGADFIAACTRTEMTLGSEIYRPGDRLARVLFPLTGFVSLVSRRPDTPGIEVGMVGSEGMVGVQLGLGVSAVPLLVLVQGAGTALALPAAAFRKRRDASVALQRILDRYVGSLLSQFATSAVCLRFHSIAPRLARWLLMSQDRANNARFPATHQFLSYMLGVRRAGVTEAAGTLQQLGAIHYERGMVTVLDRGLLEGAACSCYRAEKAAHREAMAPRRAG
jgi:CRP-like cAMP-binding protein